MGPIEEQLERELFLEGQDLVGCRRRGIWSEEDSSWSRLRGNSLLAIYGTKAGVETPAGHFQFFHKGSWLLQFRGGDWRDYWYEDFYDVWSLVTAFKYDIHISPTIMVFHENKGQLKITYVPVPDSLDPQDRVRRILVEFAADPPSRISKAGARALSVCKHCPVKLRCDSTDKLAGDTADWHPSYPYP